MTKKRSSEILADENGKLFREKVKFLKFSRNSKKISKIGWKSETGGGNASWLQRGNGRPCRLLEPTDIILSSSHAIKFQVCVFWDQNFVFRPNKK